MTKTGALIAVLLFSLGVHFPPAGAAGELVSSSPAAEATVGKAPETIRLTFDRPVVTEGSNTVTVTGPDGQQWQDGAVGIDANVLDATLRPLGPEGGYVVRYAIHFGEPSPKAGEFTFTLSKSAGSRPTWAWLGGMLVVVAAIATTGGVLQARRR
ncbi:copper resistance CopC family protein [Lentzea sp. NPDC004789]